MTDSSQTMKSIHDFKAGETITAFFIIRKIQFKTKRDGAPYLLFEFGDSTGRISATLWDNVKDVYNILKLGDIVKVKGSVLTYQDSLQLSIDKIRKTDTSDNIDIQRFIPKGKIDINRLFEQLLEKIESVGNAELKRLLHRIFKDPYWIQAFKEAPGGKLWHHAYMGGLLEHTMAVVTVCETMARLYRMVDRDLLVTGALLHDIGKIDEYGYSQGFIDFTDEGRLWGHISIGAQQIRTLIEEMEKNEGFSPELKRQLIHLILSHQGELEHGSPVLPATMEAIILYYSDEMDSKSNAIKHIIERDSHPDRRWSQYVHLLDRFIYLSPSDKHDDSP
jgi:3'-5' exoribonuclease